MISPLSWLKWLAAAIGAAFTAFLAGRVVGSRKAKEAAREADQRRADEIRSFHVDRQKVRDLDDASLDSLLHKLRRKQD